MLHKIYGAVPENAIGRYSPAECTGIRKRGVLRLAGPEARQHVLRRAAEPHHADAYAPHPAHECVLEEIREPRAHGCDLHRLVQLAPHPQEPSRDASNGRQYLKDGHVVGRYRRDDGRRRTAKEMRAI